MSRPAVLFGPVASVLVEYLRVCFTEADDDAEAHERVPTPRPARFVTIVRIGGPQHDLVIDDATLTVEAWGTDDDDAHDLAQLARAYLHAASGTVQDGIPIYRVEEFAGPANLPDPISEQPRYVFTLSVGNRGHAL